MNLDTINPQIESWLQSPIIDQTTKEEIQKLKQENPKELFEAFYANLEFGTGGLRGLMGVGNNRMNRYTVGKATQGFANYLKQTFDSKLKVIIAFDSRNNSPFFAKTAAQVLAANDIEVLLFDELRPTPQLSFLLRHFECQAGIVCTASHNPKEYNGYKAYWNDGSQLVPPHDQNVIKAIEAIPSFEDVKWHDQSKDSLIHTLGKEVDKLYIDMIIKKSIHPEAIQKYADTAMVYTPIHGTGITVLPQVLAQLGFKAIHILESQATPDGNFPTVVYPNPEEKEAMKLGLEKAKALNAEILIGTDPDSDRLAVAVVNDKQQLELLNGNQLALLAFNYVLEETAKQHNGVVPQHNMIVKTIVSTPMIDVVAKQYGCKCYNVLTGFKWIADLIRKKEGEEKFLIGGEESFGIMWGDECRDKDAISGTALFCEMVAYEKSNGKLIFDKLLELYEQHGFYYEYLVAVTKKGIEGKEEINKLMQSLRANTKSTIGDIPICCIRDYQASTDQCLKDNTLKDIHLPKSNVLQFELEDGSLISARPSGTEPKIKFYFSVNFPFQKGKTYQTHVALAMQKIEKMRSSIGI